MVSSTAFMSLTGVSILILLEVILEVFLTSIEKKSGISFNPYFTGSNSGSQNWKGDVLPSQWVSILILLEVILEDNPVQDYTVTWQCFNPYFTGSNSGSWKWLNSNSG